MRGFGGRGRGRGGFGGGGAGGRGGFGGRGGGGRGARWSWRPPGRGGQWCRWRKVAPCATRRLHLQSKVESLCTLNMVPGIAVYGEAH